MFRDEVSPYFFFRQFFELYKYFLPSQIFATRIRATDLPKAETEKAESEIQRIRILQSCIKVQQTLEQQLAAGMRQAVSSSCPWWTTVITRRYPGVVYIE